MVTATGQPYQSNSAMITPYMPSQLSSMYFAATQNQTVLPQTQSSLLLFPSQQQQQQPILSQQLLADISSDPPPPPPSPPPKPRQIRLPPNWKTAKDSEGQTYYYHTITRCVNLFSV